MRKTIIFTLLGFVIGFALGHIMTMASVSSPKHKAWWNGKTAGLVGGTSGAIIGVLGGPIGTLAGFCKARKLVLTLLTMLFLYGIACFLFGLVALTLSQPYAVYYPLLLEGFLCAILPTALYRNVRRRYEEKELRKMKSMDIS